MYKTISTKKLPQLICKSIIYANNVNIYSNEFNYLLETCNKGLYYILINKHLKATNNYNIYFFLKKNNFNKFQLFYKKAQIYYYFKLNFKGKGYRVRKFKNENKITFNLGHSHWSRIIYTSFFLFKRRRQNYPFYLVPYIVSLNIKILFRNIKKLNRYTKRGLRLKKQIIRRRFGKVSQMVSSLH